MGIGTFIISDKAAKSLEVLKYNLVIKEEDTSWEEFVDIKLAHVNTCLKELREFAKQDLNIK